MTLLSYEDQCYLLYFGLRTHLIGIDHVASIQALRSTMTEQLAVEFQVTDAEAIPTICDLFREQDPWDHLPD